MARHFTWTVVLLAAGLACRTAPSPAPVSEPAPEVVDAGAPEVEAAPRVELPPAPALPAVPLGLGPVEGPADNPTTAEKVALGHQLFFDVRLSRDGTMSCESCHHIARAYVSGEVVDAKVGGAMNIRNSPSMLNLGYHPSFYWDGRMPTLEAVSAAAWKGQLGADPAVVAEALNAVPAYRASFERAFGEPATAASVPRALAAFLRELKSGNSAYDKSKAGGAPLSREAQAGEALFVRKGCITCHVPPLFTDLSFHNVGIGQDPGRRDATKAEEDAGKFKTPSLRNVALTGPYFHDGSAATLEDAITRMAQGPAHPEVKKALNPKLDPLLKVQRLSPTELGQLKAFLESLTGDFTFSVPPQLP